MRAVGPAALARSEAHAFRPASCVRRAWPAREHGARERPERAPLGPPRGGFGAAEVEHEPHETVVPVVVSGHRIDRAGQLAVWLEELRPVLLDLSCRIDHVAADEEKLSPGPR